MLVWVAGFTNLLRLSRALSASCLTASLMWRVCCYVRESCQSEITFHQTFFTLMRGTENLLQYFLPFLSLSHTHTASLTIFSSYSPSASALSVLFVLHSEWCNLPLTSNGQGHDDWIFYFHSLFQYRWTVELTRDWRSDSDGNHHDDLLSMNENQWSYFFQGTSDSFLLTDEFVYKIRRHYLCGMWKVSQNYICGLLKYLSREEKSFSPSNATIIITITFVICHSSETCRVYAFFSHVCLYICLVLFLYIYSV